MNSLYYIYNSRDSLYFNSAAVKDNGFVFVGSSKINEARPSSSFFKTFFYIDKFKKCSSSYCNTYSSVSNGIEVDSDGYDEIITSNNIKIPYDDFANVLKPLYPFVYRYSPIVLEHVLTDLYKNITPNSFVIYIKTDYEYDRIYKMVHERDNVELSNVLDTIKNLQYEVKYFKDSYFYKKFIIDSNYYSIISLLVTSQPCVKVTKTEMEHFRNVISYLKSHGVVI